MTFIYCGGLILPWPEQENSTACIPIWIYKYWREMTEIARLRLIHQQILSSHATTPAGVVAALGAMQAQDYASALWGIGVRLPTATERDIERAVTDRKIVRTWPLRGTLHFVAATDVHGMLELLAPRVIAGSALRQQRLELNTAVFERCRKLFVRNLEGNRQLSRSGMMKLLEDNGISTAQYRGYHILWRMALERVVCFAGRVDKEQTFALLEEWIPPSRKLDREAAVAELARRYFGGHGPATLKDFAWWSGLKISEARGGVEGAGAKLVRMKFDGEDYWMPQSLPAAIPARPAAFLLPGFDEFLLGYQNRSATLEPKHAQKVVPGGNGMFLPFTVHDGRVAGTWKRTINKKGVKIVVKPFGRLTKSEKDALTEPARRYGEFLRLPVVVGY